MADPVLKVIVDFTDGLEFDEVTDIADISDLVLSVSTRRGRTTALDLFETGTAAVSFKDLTGDWSPDNLSSIYAGKLKPMRKIMITGSTYSGTEVFPVFYGYITNFATAFAQGTDEVNRVTLSCVDAFKVLSNSVITSVTGAAAGDSTEDRFLQILDQINWPFGLTVSTPGTNTVQTDDGTQRNVLEALRLVEASEYGAIFVSKGGEVTFLGQADLDINVYDPVWEFADDGSALPYTDMKIGHDDSLLYNDITVFAPSIADAHVSDSASQTKYFTRAAIRNTINDTLAGSTDVAENLLNFTKNTDVRVDAISVSLLGQSSEAFPYAYLLANIMDPIKVTRQMPGSYVFEKYLIIQGIDHDISPNRWDVTYKTSNPYFSVPSGYYLASLLGDDVEPGSPPVLPDIATDSTGNAYVMSHDLISTVYSSSVIKFTPSGSQVSSNRYYLSGYDAKVESINTDSAGNFYLVGNLINTSTSAPSGFIIKTTAAGSIIWQKSLVRSLATTNFIGIDSSDNIYVNVDGYVFSTLTETVVKINSSGTVQWQKDVTTPYKAIGGCDSAGNVYLLQKTYPGTRLTKLNSSGVVQWATDFADFDLTAFTADASGYIYIAGAGNDPAASYNDAAFFKYDSSGTMVWANSMSTFNPETATIASIYFKDNKIEFTGNLYNPTGDYYYGMIGQITTDGDFVWMNNFYDTNFESGPYPVQGLRVVSKSSNAIIFAGTATDLANDPITLFGRIPSDGSRTATYELPSGNTIPYLAGNGTMTSFSPSEASATISTSTGSVTISSGTISVGTTSITSESVEMV
ncbi:hypothetical protein UFOVP1495_26 [uncultured Caudovirales phage]|uniref:Uncharacterized protein n=1 Tax=uncultured Caudovirales phage TaxID=2100421 RepID=A0A6J5SSE1_9CAUD|nr:hypothetical protein UFOVP1135_28 [uncultured Caudovirales phage]CAB4194282.1 hypothetical protein UFOVP1253_21 [uncultured Caudovirales phage]CAB4217397.1 hypothetical protein UFOVP1495_26 [uncultured Caudovirales phage]